jgi:serine/threonine-protein kinase
MSFLEHLKGLIGRRGAAAADAPDSYVGARLKERYDVVREIGRGAIGVVYVASDRDVHGRLVVVKALQGEASHNEWLVKKFHHESEALARIDHRGVVKVLDRGRTPHGHPFFVMELVKGETLRDRIAAGGLSLAEAADVVRQIAYALGAAHTVGVFHRDLKPENVMLQSGGGLTVKLIDFGIAKVEEPSSATSTVTPVAAGTLIYMSPEQLERGESSAASDTYALGVIAYELLTGALPYNPDAPTILAQMNQIARLQRAGAAPPPSSIRDELSADVDEVLARALAYDPKRRFATAPELGDALVHALGGLAAPAPGAHASRAETLAEPRYVPPAPRAAPARGRSSPGNPSEYKHRLAVSRLDEGLVTILALEGFLDAHTAPTLQAALDRAVAEGRAKILCNCQQLSYIASAGLGVFMGGLPLARERGGDIKLCNVPEGVLHVMELLGLHHLFEIYETESEGVAAFGA